MSNLQDFCGNSGQDNWCAGPQGKGAQCLCPHRVLYYLKEKPADAKKFKAGGCAEKDLGANMPVNAQELKDLKSKTA